MLKTLLSLLFIVNILCFLMACGQSGPLYLPGQTPPIKVPDETTSSDS